MTREGTDGEISIASLLAKRQVRLLGSGGSADTAKRRQSICRQLADNFIAFDRLRLALIHPESHQLPQHDKEARAVGEWLVGQKLLNRSQTGNGVALLKIDQAEIRAFLNGQWLEMYVWNAFIEAGADEVRYNQKVEWQIDDVTGINEIDIIARKG
jgi:hypothetical protein